MVCLTKKFKQSTDNSMSTEENALAHIAVKKPEKHNVVETFLKPFSYESESVLFIKSLNVTVTSYSLVLLVLNFANFILFDGSPDRSTSTLLFNFQLLEFQINIIAGVFRSLWNIDFKKRQKVIVTVFLLMLLVLNITNGFLSDSSLNRVATTVSINFQLLMIAAYILAGIFGKMWEIDFNKRQKVILLLACFLIRLVVTSVETFIEIYLGFEDQYFYKDLCLVEVLWTMIVLSTVNVCLLAMIIHRFLRLFIREFYNKTVVYQV